MKVFRSFLVTAFAVLCAIGTIAISTVSAKAATANFAYQNIQAGTTVVWYPISGETGFNLTDGGLQELRVYLTEVGNKLDTGIYQVAQSKYISMYSGTLSGNNTGVLSQILSTGSGYYRIYVKNNNASVSFTVTDSSYLTYN